MIKFLTPFNQFGEVGLVVVKGYKIDENYACFNALQLKEHNIMFSRKYKWRLCYKIDCNCYWLVRSYKTKQELLADFENTKLDVLHNYEENEKVKETIRKRLEQLIEGLDHDTIFKS